jgi:hypothetical protein
MDNLLARHSRSMPQLTCARTYYPSRGKVSCALASRLTVIRIDAGSTRLKRFRDGQTS